jgi:hypothetical protein
MRRLTDEQKLVKNLLYAYTYGFRVPSLNDGEEFRMRNLLVDLLAQRRRQLRLGVGECVLLFALYFTMSFTATIWVLQTLYGR